LVDWGKVLTGVGLVVAGGTATGGAVAGEIGSVGVGTAGASILSISEVENMTGLALTLGSISSDVNEMNQNLSVFVQGAPTSITVTSPGIYIQPVPSQISLPDTLTASGGGGGVDPRTGFDPGDDDSN
jgi:hypothetical protein